MPVAPLFPKNVVTGLFESCTKLGSAAPAMPDVDAGPVKPMVAYESSANSGYTAKNAGLMPEAFQLTFRALL